MATGRRTGKSSKRSATRGSGARKSIARKTATRRSAAPRRASSARPPARRASGRARSRRSSLGVTLAPGATDSIANGIGLLVQSADFDSHAIADLQRFYTEVMGFTDFVENGPEGELMVRTGFGAFLSFRPPEPGPPEAWRPPREPALTFYVSDVDRAHRDLVARGASFDQDPTDLPDGRRVATLRDPEGRVVMLVRPRSGP